MPSQLGQLDCGVISRSLGDTPSPLSSCFPTHGITVTDIYYVPGTVMYIMYQLCMLCLGSSAPAAVCKLHFTILLREAGVTRGPRQRRQKQRGPMVRMASPVNAIVIVDGSSVL